MLSRDHYTALTRAAGLVDRSDRGLIAVAGQDRAALLHNILTNEIATLLPGQGCYAAYLTPQGRMVSDMRVLAMRDAIWLDVPGEVTQRLRDKLDRSIFAEDVRISDRSSDVCRVGLFGPRAAREISRTAGNHQFAEELSALSEYHHRTTRMADADVVVVRDGDLGVPGFALYLPGATIQTVDAVLPATEFPRVDAETADVLRVENGRPKWGAELDEDVIPMEAGIESRAISFTKGCYIGQEVIVRILHRGHGRVARRLVGIVLETSGSAARGDRIYTEDRDVGLVTSAVMSPALERPVALAYVHRDHVAPGTAVTVRHGAAIFPATVVSLPF